MTISDKSVLRYPGGKYRARKILETHLPENTTHVLSPFLGGGSFELFLTSKGVQVTGTDNFYLLVNFWHHLLNDNAQLAHYCQQYLNKADKDLFNTKQQELKLHNNAYSDNNAHNVGNNEKLQQAGDFFIVNRCSFSGATLSGGYSKESATTRFNQSIVNKVRTFANSKLTTECLDYQDSINKYADDTNLIFLDPPYALDNNSKLYGVKGDKHKDFNHDEFYEFINQCDNKILLTYNDNEYIRQKWKDYNITEENWKYGMNKNKQSSELVIKNY